MRKSGDSSTLIRIPFHIREEEMRRHIQSMDGLTHQADLLTALLKEMKEERILVIKILTRKFGALSMPTKILFHGNTEETKKPTQLMDGLIHQADLVHLLKMLLIRKTFLIRTSMRRSGASLMLTKTLFLIKEGESKNHTQLMDG